MSDSYAMDGPNGSGVTTTGTSGTPGSGVTTGTSGTAGSAGTMDTAKQEAGAVKDTAVSDAKDVIATAKDEASMVLGEAKSQAKDLYLQTQQELKDQAGTQQQRLASGLRSVSDELRSMASASGAGGVASDLVRQASTRLSSASTWLGDRDPGAVLTEVKRFARRKPGTFILAAAITGVVVGRLTRALASVAADESKEREARAAMTRGDAWTPSTTTSASSMTSPTTSSTLPGTEVPMAETPIYAQSAPGLAGVRAEGDDDRSDTI